MEKLDIDTITNQLDELFKHHTEVGHYYIVLTDFRTNPPQSLCFAGGILYKSKPLKLPEMRVVKFKVINLADKPKRGSEVVTGGEYEGEISEAGNKVYYTDETETQWIFYPGSTCEIIH